MLGLDRPWWVAHLQLSRARVHIGVSSRTVTIERRADHKNRTRTNQIEVPGMRLRSKRGDPRPPLWRCYMSSCWPWKRARIDFLHAGPARSAPVAELLTNRRTVAGVAGELASRGVSG